MRCLRGSARALVAIAAIGVLSAVACGGDANRGDARAQSAPLRDVANRGANAQELPSLAHAAGGDDGRTYRVVDVTDGGAVTGTITSATALTADTTIVPTHDLATCARFVDHPFPGKDGGVGNAIVWLGGVASGPAIDAPRRATLALHDCQLDPRILRVAAGGTVLVNSHDAMVSRLRFIENGTGTLRATVTFNDAGEVVPTEHASAAPGIVLVRDDLHPWVRAYLAVAPHPFVAVTGPDGQFRFGRVPPGRYTLNVWHERLGVETTNVVVTSGRTTEQAMRLR